MSLSTQNILALDTALFGCSVALHIAGDNAEYSRSETMARGQAEVLVPMIKSVIEDDAGKAFSDLNMIVTTVGPGAFTGLRVGISTARALGLSLDIPVIGVTTLDVLAYEYLQKNEIPKDTQLCVLIETKRQDYYCGLYNYDGDAINEAAAISSAQVIKGINNKKIIIIGDAVDRFLSEGVKQEGWQEDSAYGLPDPLYIAKLGEKKFILGNSLPPSPVYLRNADVSLSNKQRRKIKK